MKLNISRISRSKYGAKNFDDVTSNLLSERKSFINYKLDEAKSRNITLVFKNSDYLKMLRKGMSGTISYSLLFMFMAIIVTFILTKVNPYGGVDFTATSIVLIVMSLLFIFWMFINLDIPKSLVFYGVIISEKNLFGKNIRKFNPKKVESFESVKLGEDFVSLSTKTGEDFMSSWKILIIVDNNGKGEKLIDKYFESFSYENLIKKD